MKKKELQNPLINGRKVGDVWLHHPDGKVYIWTDLGLKEANGASLDKALYPILFDVIGGSYGQDGYTFCLPDYRELFKKT